MSSPALLGAQRFETAGAVTASTEGTAISAASAHTKGSYVQLIASTAFHAQGVLLVMGIVPTVAKDFLVDLAIGGAGSEQIIAADIFFSATGSTRRTESVFIPVPIPAGTRLSARLQGTTTSTGLSVVAILVAGGAIRNSSVQVCTTYGANTADTGGTGVDPGAVAHTKGSYAEVTSATTRAIKHLIIAFGLRNNLTIDANTSWMVDIAIGAAASEQVIIANLPLAAHATTDMVFPQYHALPCNIPAGARIAARAQSTNTDATDRLIDVIIYGVG